MWVSVDPAACSRSFAGDNCYTNVPFRFWTSGANEADFRVQSLRGLKDATQSLRGNTNIACCCVYLAQISSVKGEMEMKEADVR